MLILYHYGAIILVLSKLLSFVILKYKNAVNGIFTITIAGASILGLYLLKGTVLGNLVENKIGGYASYSIRGTWQTVSGWFRILGVTLPLVLNVKLRKKELIVPNYVLLILLIINIVQFRNYQMVLRFGDAFVIASPLTIVPYYANKNKIFSLQKIGVYELAFLLGAMLNFGLIVIFGYKMLSFKW